MSRGFTPAMEHAVGEGRDYSGGPRRPWFAALATLAAGALLAAVIAWWVWQLFGPAPLRVAAAQPRDPTATLLASGLFGGASTGAPSTAAMPASAVADGSARLLGILAERDGSGYALFRLPSGPKLVAPGNEVTAGVTLVSVEPLAVTVREGARERRLSLWPESGSTPTAARKPASAPLRAIAPRNHRASATHDASCSAPAGFSGPVIRLNPELLGGLANEPTTWSSLLESSPDGLVVRNNGGYAAMLGLAAGDRIELANGIPLRLPADVASAVLRPLIDRQGVRITGTRAGVRRELWIASSACAG